MLIELSPTAYMALCGLVKDALLEKSDASPLLERVAKELAGAMTSDLNTADMIETPQHLDALRRAGFAA